MEIYNLDHKKDRLAIKKSKQFNKNENNLSTIDIDKVNLISDVLNFKFYTKSL